jgi:hypothetical protein
MIIGMIVTEKIVPPLTALRVRSLKGHRVLTPVNSQADLTGEMFDRRCDDGSLA